MPIYKYDVYRSPNIGIYSKTNDSFVFVPNGFAKTKSNKLASYLKTECIFTSVANSRLLGPFMVLNNKGILLPRNCLESELENLKKSTGLNVEFLDTKYTALGNLICANDKGGIVSTLISRQHAKKIEDVLGIEVIQKKIGEYTQVGALVVATANGGVIHPDAEEDDIKSVSDALGVTIEPATINGGIPFVGSGILANNNAVVVGSLTNGPEFVMLTRSFNIQD